MAGMTKLQAVNQILLAVRSGAVSALDSGGGSDHGQAEFVLDMVTDTFIIAGHPSTTKAEQVYTASVAGEVDVGSSPVVLAVVGHGKRAGHRLTLRGTKVYDEAYGTTQFCASGETNIILSIRYKPSNSSPNDFEDLDPGLKVNILQEAIRQFRAIKAFDPLMDQHLERIQAASIAAGVGQHSEARPAPSKDSTPFMPLNTGGNRQGR